MCVCADVGRGGCRCMQCGHAGVCADVGTSLYDTGMCVKVWAGVGACACGYVCKCKH